MRRSFFIGYTSKYNICKEITWNIAAYGVHTPVVAFCTYHFSWLSSSSWLLLLLSLLLYYSTTAQQLALAMSSVATTSLACSCMSSSDFVGTV